LSLRDAWIAASPAPSARQRVLLSLRFASSFSSFSSRSCDAAVLLLAQRLALDLELHDAAVDLVDLRRHRVDLHPQPRRGLVDEIDRLVGQEAIGDVAVREDRGGDRAPSP
jgi:hypothetical protein